MHDIKPSLNWFYFEKLLKVMNRRDTNKSERGFVRLLVGQGVLVLEQSSQQVCNKVKQVGVTSTSTWWHFVLKYHVELDI